MKFVSYVICFDYLYFSAFPCSHLNIHSALKMVSYLICCKWSLTDWLKRNRIDCLLSSEISPCPRTQRSFVLSQDFARQIKQRDCSQSIGLISQMLFQPLKNTIIYCNIKGFTNITFLPFTETLFLISRSLAKAQSQGRCVQSNNFIIQTLYASTCV